MIETDVIKAAIKSVISVLENLTAPLPIKTAGRTFNIPNDQKYFEIILMQNNSLLANPRNWVGASATWGDEKTFQGIIRVLLHWPNDDGGIYVQSDILANLKEEFKKGSWLYNGEAKLMIYDHPSLTDVVEDGQELIFPLTIPYQSFHAS